MSASQDVYCISNRAISMSVRKPAMYSYSADSRRTNAKQYAAKNEFNYAENMINQVVENKSQAGR